MEHYPFVREGPYRRHIVFHCEIHVGGAGAVFRALLLELFDDCVVQHRTEAPAGAEFRERQTFGVGQFYLGVEYLKGFMNVGLDTAHPVAQFRHDSKYRDFVERNLVKIVGHFYLQMPVLVEADIYLRGFEMESAQPFPVVAVDVAYLAGYVIEFRIGETKPPQMLEFLFER